MRLEHGTTHHITNIKEFPMQYKLLTEIEPKTILLQNMGYRFNQGNTRLKNTPEIIHSDIINVNHTRILRDHPYSFFLLPSSFLLINDFTLKIYKQENQKYMFMEKNACNAHNTHEGI